MRAWRLREFGEPENVVALEEVPVPVAGPGELLVRVAAATLNFNDVDGVRGRYRTVRPPLPYTPGMEVLGHVEVAGAGAEAWVGKRVVAVPTGAFGGGASERVVVSPSRAHTQVAQAALRQALQRRAGSSGGADAVLLRDRHGLRVRLDGVDRLDHKIRGLVVAEVAAALRAFDAQAPRIDIALAAQEPT